MISSDSPVVFQITVVKKPVNIPPIAPPLVIFLEYSVNRITGPNSTKNCPRALGTCSRRDGGNPGFKRSVGEKKISRRIGRTGYGIANP